jgi:hypothetical protein
VRAFVASKPYNGIANVLLFASAGPLDAPADDDPRAPVADAEWGRPVAAMLAHELTPTGAELAAAPAMTDDYAPLDTLLAGTAVRWRASLQAGMRDLLLR